MIDAACAELLSPGSLRVGINKGNILLVTGEAGNGDPRELLTQKVERVVADRPVKRGRAKHHDRANAHEQKDREQDEIAGQIALAVAGKPCKP